VIRSGEQALFEAHLHTSRKRAEQNEAMARMARAMEPWMRACRQLGVSMAVASERLAKSLGAFQRSQEAAALTTARMLGRRLRR
jgi:hypothetical protein